MIDYREAYIALMQQMLDLHGNILNRVDQLMIEGTNIAVPRELLAVADRVISMVNIEMLNLEVSE